MFQNFKVEDQQNPALFHYKKRLFGHNTLYFGISHLLNINGQKYYPFSIHFIKDEEHIRYLMKLDESEKYKTFLTQSDYKLYENNAFKNNRIIEFKINIIEILITYFSRFLLELSKDEIFLEKQDYNFKQVEPQLLFIEFLINFILSFNFLTNTFSNDSINQIQQKLNINFLELKTNFDIFINKSIKNIHIPLYIPNVPYKLLIPNIKLPNVPTLE
jgi:hypothetical protein